MSLVWSSSKSQILWLICLKLWFVIAKRTVKVDDMVSQGSKEDGQGRSCGFLVNYIFIRFLCKMISLQIDYDDGDSDDGWRNLKHLFVTVVVSCIARSS